MQPGVDIFNTATWPRRFLQEQAQAEVANVQVFSFPLNDTTPRQDEFIVSGDAPFSSVGSTFMRPTGSQRREERRSEGVQLQEQVNERIGIEAFVNRAFQRVDVQQVFRDVALRELLGREPTAEETRTHATRV